MDKMIEKIYTITLSAPSVDSSHNLTVALIG
jgi:hypothetical protein